MMQQQAPSHGENEILVCRYRVPFGQPFTPHPPLFETDNSSTPWSMAECKSNGSVVVVIWTRRTLAPLKGLTMIDAAVPQPVPPPTALPPVYQDNVGGAPADGAYENGNARLQMPLITQGPPAPPVLSSPSHAPPAPPPIAALPLHYHLPHYARPRPELALQRNVTVRGGVMPTMPIIAPGYQPPPTTQAPSTVGYHTPPVAPPIASVAYGSDGLLAGAEVRSYGGPLPPSPLDAAPAVPPEPQLGASHFASPTTQPPQPLYTPPPQAPQAANAAVSSRQAVDPHGNQSAPLTAPPRHVVPPVHPTTSPVDRAMFPRVPAVVAEPLPVEPPAP